LYEIRSFEISNDEQVIGCELDEEKKTGREYNYFSGLTWLFMKISD
jgi:hypothetical protein